MILYRDDLKSTKLLFRVELKNEDFFSGYLYKDRRRAFLLLITKLTNQIDIGEFTIIPILEQLLG